MKKRPPKPRNLSRKRILDCALEIASQHGVSALRVRQLAERLDVTPMSIYRHFKNKDALLAAMLDEFIAHADLLPREPIAWDAWVLQVGQRMAEVLSAEPDWIQLLGHIEMNPDSQGLLLQGLHVLLKAGFTAPQAMQAFFAMTHIAIGTALVYQGIRQIVAGVDGGRHDAAYLEDMQQRFGALSVLADAQRAEHGLRLLLDGMRAQLGTKQASGT